jgi:acetoin utilization deacetylase AcuC-like enzyme
LHEIVFPFLEKTDPEMILLSFGFDTHWKDPLGSMQVSAQCIHQIIKDLVEWTDKKCGGKLAIVLEGGYDLEAAKANGQAISTALMKQDWQDLLGPSPAAETDNWMVTLNSARELWGI